MSKTVAVIGPASSDECARYMADAFIALGADVRMIDPLRIRETIKRELSITGVNEHYAMRKPISLNWLLEHHDPNCDLRGCSIVFMTDNPIELVNDLPPFDEIGNRPVVVFYHNEYNQPPACMNPDIACYGQPQLKALTHALYPWQTAHWRREFDLLGAVFPDRFTKTPLSGREHGLTWINDNFHGQNLQTWKWTRWHSLANDIWRTLDDDVHACGKAGVKLIGLEGEVDRDMYLHELSQSRAHVFMTPMHLYQGRRLFEAMAVGTIPVIHVQTERFGWTDTNDYNWKLDKFYSHDKFLRQAGFIDGVNCLMFYDFRQLAYLSKFVADDENLPILQEIAGNAHQLLLDRHTYLHRARQVLTEVQLYHDILLNQHQENDTGVGLPYTRKEVTL